MGSAGSSSSRRDPTGRLLTAIEEANLTKVIKAIKKGANIRGIVYPARPPSREARIPSLPSLTPLLWSALMHACYLGHNLIVQILLQQGADLGAKSMDGVTALMVASQEGHVHVVEELLKHISKRREGAQIPPLPPPPGPHTPNIMQAQIPPDIAAAYTTPPTAAASFVSGDMQEPIVPRSASSFDPILDAVNAHGQTALLKAAALGYSPIVELLVRGGANVCVADHIDGMTALAWSAEHGPSEIVMLLIQAGSNINRKNHNGQTPLLCAASKTYDYNAPNAMEQRHHPSMVVPGTATHTDETQQHREESKSQMPSAVSASSASSSSSVPSGSNTRWGVSSSSPTSVVLTLLANGADKDATNHDKYTPLMVAAHKGHSAVVELLLAFKANVNARAEKGQTALMLATAQCHSRIAELIIRSGAQLNLVDEKGESALHKASTAGDQYTAECLLTFGAELDLKEHVHGNTPLLLASKHMHGGIVQLLLQKGAQPDERNHRGETPLMLACARGHSYTAGVLIRGGADPTLTDNAGNTPLILAARAGSDSVVELLLDLDVSLDSNHLDEGPLGVALSCGSSHAVVVELLVAAGAEPTNAHATQYTLKSTHTDTDLHALTPVLRDAIERGLAGRDRFERRDRRYGDIVQAVKSRMAAHPADDRSSSPTRKKAMPHMRMPSQEPCVNDSPTTHPATHPTPLTRHSSDLTQLQSGIAASALSSSSPDGSGASLSALLTPLRSWSVPVVLAWLQSLSLPQYTSAFSDASVDGEMLCEFVTCEGEQLLITELKIDRKLHRMKIMREIRKLIGNDANSAMPAGGVHPPDNETHTNQTSNHTIDMSAALPIATSISNPLPVSSLTPLQPSSSIALYPTPLPPSSPPTVKASPASSATIVATAAPLDTGINIFSPTFDFNDLSGLAPLSSGLQTGGSSLQSSLANSPAGSADLMPHIDAIAPIRKDPSSHNSSVTVPIEYAYMAQADLEPVPVPVANSLPNPPPETPLPSPPIQTVARAPTPPARRILYSDLTFRDVIGEGQFGTVYLGSWRGAQVAIKQLRISSHAINTACSESHTHPTHAAPPPALDSPHIQLFLQEAALMQLLGNHPNLITFLGICMPDADADQTTATDTHTATHSTNTPTSHTRVGAKDVCIVTSFFPLGSVRDLLITRKTLSKIPSSVLPSVSAVGPSLSALHAAARPLSLLTLLRMCRDIACGILHLHLDSIIHRDIAARNCLVDEFSMSVRVADFGLSRFLVSNREDAAYTNSSVGPLKWMAPESVIRHEYSEKSDAYAYGITLSEILFARDPYPDHLALEAAIHASHDPSFRPALPSDCPPPLADLMRHCWQHAPKDRPTFKQIIARIERIETFLRQRIAKHAAEAPTTTQASDTDHYAWSTECWATFTLE